MGKATGRAQKQHEETGQYPGLETVCLWGCGCLAFVLPERRAQGAKACLGLGITLLGSTHLVRWCLYGPDRLSPAVSTVKVSSLVQLPSALRVLCPACPAGSLIGTVVLCSLLLWHPLPCLGLFQLPRALGNSAFVPSLWLHLFGGSTFCCLKGVPASAWPCGKHQATYSVPWF